MSNKEQLIEILTQRYKRFDGVYRRNAFDREARYQYYSFDEIRTLDDIDLDKIIQLYQSKTTELLSIHNRLLLLNCVYETIAGNKKYQDVFDKLIDIYKIELDDRLTKPTTSYDDFNFVETNELHQAPYTTMPEYSSALANMCARYMYEAQKSYTESSIIPPTKVESRLSTYEAIKSDFAKSGKQMPEAQEQIVSQAKVMIVQANEERNAIAERERQQREIELINLQQEIIKMENEKLEIEKRIKEISTETLGSYYSKQVSEKYPEEYQRFQQQKYQVKNYSSSQTSISDIKARFSKISEELQLYKEALPVYESFYQRFEEMKREHQQQRTNHSQESKPMSTSSSILSQSTIEQQNNQVISQIDKPQPQVLLTNISDELKQNISQYIKRQSKMIYVKNIDINNIYQEGNFIIVDAKDSLGHSIERKFTIEDFSKLFMQQLPELKHNETPQHIQEPQQDSLQKATINEPAIKDVNIETIINQIKGQYPDVTMIEANGTFEYEGQFRVNVTNNNGTHTSIIVDKETYDQLEEYFKQHPQTISTHISKFKPIEKPVQQEQEMTPEKNKLINDIISAMLNAGEFNNSGMDISQKMDDIEYAKRNLATKSLEELQWALSVYTPQQEEVHSVMHR